MSLENDLFKKNYHYNAVFVNRCIMVIKFSKNEKRVRAYKNLIYRMMKDVVKKNICNYINLLKGTNCREIPDRSELIADCYIIFDKCLEKYKVRKAYNFYFYFNKSLSRNFFRYYQRELKNSNIELTEAIFTVHPKLHDTAEPDTTSVLIQNFNFTEIEKKIIDSRMIGHKTSEFLKENPTVTNGQYSRALKNIKETLIHYQNKGEF